MIDWIAVIFGAFWILGLSLVIAALSLANYFTKQENRSFRKLLETSPSDQMISLGLLFFCLGWTGVAGGWERVIWGIFALVFAGKFWLRIKPRKT